MLVLICFLAFLRSGFGAVTQAQCDALAGGFKTVINEACYVFDDVATATKMNRATAINSCTQLPGGHLPVVTESLLDQLFIAFNSTANAFYTEADNYNFHTALERVDTSSDPDLTQGWSWLVPSQPAQPLVEPGVWLSNEPNNHSIEPDCDPVTTSAQNTGVVWLYPTQIRIIDSCHNEHGYSFLFCQYGEPATTTTTTTSTTTTSTTTTSTTTTSTTTTPAATTTTTGVTFAPDVQDKVDKFDKAVNFSNAKTNPIQTSSAVSDSMPFMIGGLDYPLQQNLSWKYSDLMSDCTFSEQNCDLPNDIVVWFEPNMGNCITFNHEDVYRRYKYKIKHAGLKYGLSMFLTASQEDYLPWTTIAGHRVFVHNQSDTVYAESIGYGAPPGYVTTLALRYTLYRKLGSPYSDCVKGKEELKYFYYSQDYSIEGCYRSCYQNQVNEVCGCADPRYPSGLEMRICEIQDRECLNNFLTTSGNPDNWDCSDVSNCPLPCTYGQYNPTVTRTPFLDTPSFCRHLSGELLSNCTTQTHKNVMKVEIFFEDTNYVLYQETQRYPLFKFVSRTGGQLGILCGMSVISITEILFLLLQLAVAFAVGSNSDDSVPVFNNLAPE